MNKTVLLLTLLATGATQAQQIDDFDYFSLILGVKYRF